MPQPPPPAAAAPQSAQHANYAAFAPEPATRSERHDFIGANPAAAQPQKYSPGLTSAAAHHNAGDDNRARAEKSGSSYL